MSKSHETSGQFLEDLLDAASCLSAELKAGSLILDNIIDSKCIDPEVPDLIKKLSPKTLYRLIGYLDFPSTQMRVLGGITDYARNNPSIYSYCNAISAAQEVDEMVTLELEEEFEEKYPIGTFLNFLDFVVPAYSGVKHTCEYLDSVKTKVCNKLNRINLGVKSFLLKRQMKKFCEYCPDPKVRELINHALKL